MSILNKNHNANDYVKHACDFHCHGVGRFDFTEIASINLDEIESILASRGSKSVLTLYLPKENFSAFLRLMDKFDSGRLVNKYPHILGIAIEGPLLSSHGGTPHRGVWIPSKSHWSEIAECGKKGLLYVILSPDFDLNSGKQNVEYPDKITWIAEKLLEYGVMPTPGHFRKDCERHSAKMLQRVFNVVHEAGFQTVTDHLFNDMPRNFKHAWRTENEKQLRQHELLDLNLDEWSLENIEERMGLIPATIIRNAKKGIVKIAQNFDGEHVDLAVVKKTIEIVGHENIIMMTDSIESRRLAGYDLTCKKGSNLLYQEEGIVAAGGLGVRQQIENMITIGLSKQQIMSIIHKTPLNVIKQCSREKSNEEIKAISF
ncbi:N-acetylglucosamine-6-phosphate deacetylase [Piscirickettsia salmonis]|uniref:hypothetical protein n=1 Tax=Piscirickettsia salmonis TaxID=1238 RepID=UPI0012B6E3D9|nr:hypothetical protein [Piscirickettsia salmonis]QGP48891.1 N-acetylglucosamine-6-phosphate deacetylase [Piscirickettsia salmonis]QGP56366.1 N-acetylglucosamine-6-phosphate deacetylase [Piscirickettsia salmonis]QGP57771.1 N-acetylglucosamine-6-phosphate deacetylase [Piscirickettsia salmonis]QGP65929.1 N-acetylglucosamine-6-phosphate deacetylase [Piscirickettsia salmonis]